VLQWIIPEAAKQVTRAPKMQMLSTNQTTMEDIFPSINPQTPLYGQAKD